MTEPYESEKLPAHREPPAASRTDATGAPGQRDRLRAPRSHPSARPSPAPRIRGDEPIYDPRSNIAAGCSPRMQK